MLSLQKTNFYHSFHSLIFQSKIHSHPGTFFERGWGNSLKETYVEEEGGGGLHVKWTRMNQGEQVKKLAVSSEHTFWITQKSFRCN